jgi:predicted nucleic acid-binding protein
VRIVADTSGIVAALNSAEPRHQDFRDAVNSAVAVYLTPIVVAETHHVLTSGGAGRAASGFLAAIRDGRYTLTEPTRSEYGLADDLIQRYRGQMRRKRVKPGSLDLADAMNVVMAARLNTDLILTMDQDYRAVRPLSPHPAFRLVPWDQ